MKLSLFACIPLLSLMAVAATATEELQTLSYRTFVDYVKDGALKSVVISTFGGNDMKVTVEKNGEQATYYVDKPYKAKDDSLLLDFLAEKKIPCEIFEENIGSRAENMWAVMLPALLMFALPSLLLFIVLIVGFVILSKVSHIERMAEAARQAPREGITL